MRLHGVKVKTLPIGKPYPLSCSDHFGIFFSIATSGMQTICTRPLFLGWFWSERLSEWSRVDGRWNTCSERWLCVFLHVLCVASCFCPPPQRVFTVFMLPSAISNCLLLFLCNWAAYLSAHVAHAKSTCYRMICQDWEDVFTSTCTCHKHYPNLTFGQQ